MRPRATCSACKGSGIIDLTKGEDLRTWSERNPFKLSWEWCPQCFAAKKGTP